MKWYREKKKAIEGIKEGRIDCANIMQTSESTALSLSWGTNERQI